MGKDQETRASDQRQFWEMAIETHRESGLSVAAFCKNEGITEAAFYYWRKKLRQNSCGSAGQDTPAFIEVKVPDRSGLSLELLLTSGNTLRIAPGFDDQSLRDVLSVLRQSGLC